MDVVIYTQSGCPLCDQVKAHYGSGNYEERPVEALLNGVDQNMDAMVQLAIQNMELPLVQVNGGWTPPQEVLKDECRCS